MGAGVTHANHLGSLLTLASNARFSASPAGCGLPAFDFQGCSMEEPGVYRSNDDASSTRTSQRNLNEFQQGVMKAKAQLRAEGLPEGQP